jgi:uncharacterized protein
LKTLDRFKRQKKARSASEGEKMQEFRVAMLKLDSYFSQDDAIIAAFIFGSFPRGQHHPGSDVDIAILLDERRRKIDRKGLLDRLLPELGRLLRQDVHILILNDASYVARVEALFRGKVAHCKDAVALAEFRMVSHALFADFAPFLRQLEANLRKRLAG